MAPDRNLPPGRRETIRRVRGAKMTGRARRIPLPAFPIMIGRIRARQVTAAAPGRGTRVSRGAVRDPAIIIRGPGPGADRTMLAVYGGMTVRMHRTGVRTAPSDSPDRADLVLFRTETGPEIPSGIPAV